MITLAPSLGIDMTAALSMGAETIDDRHEPIGSEGKLLGNALAEQELLQPQSRIQLAPSRDSIDEPPGRPGWGMQWGKQGDNWHLFPVASAIKELAADANELSLNVPKHISTDIDVLNMMEQYEEAVRNFILTKRAMNRIAGKRKLQAEIDDASWLWCQAAKYKRDATEKRAWWVRYGADLTQSQKDQLEALRDYGMSNITEAFIMSRALTRAVDIFDPEDRMLTEFHTIKWTFEESAKRVLRASCNKLTQYFDTRSPRQVQALVTKGDQIDYGDNFYT